jgi:hypothetical protein
MQTYSPNYPVNIIRRADIALKVANTTKEYYQLEDIISNLELDAKEDIMADRTCHIPWVGTFWHNKRICYQRCKDKLIEAKATLDPIAYINFKKETLGVECRVFDYARRRIALSGTNAKKMPKWYKYLCKRYGVEIAKTIIAFGIGKNTVPIGDTLVRL